MRGATQALARRRISTSVVRFDAIDTKLVAHTRSATSCSTKEYTVLAGKMTLKLQLILAVTVPCIALLLVGGASLNSMGTIQQQSTELYRNTAAPMRAMARCIADPAHAGRHRYDAAAGHLA